MRVTIMTCVAFGASVIVAIHIEEEAEKQRD